MERQKKNKRARPWTPVKVRAPPRAPAEEASTATATARRDQEVSDEEVDRFFALLADIREMRELWRRNGCGAPETTKKKTRVDRAEQIWRPAFVMEDFNFEMKGGVDS